MEAGDFWVHTHINRVIGDENYRKLARLVGWIYDKEFINFPSIHRFFPPPSTVYIQSFTYIGIASSSLFLLICQYIVLTD